jgi:hypothetical protein
LRAAKFVWALIACATVVPANGTDLATESGHELGLTLSAYRYSEPGFMRLEATKMGLDYVGTYAIGGEWPHRNKGWFLRVEARYATGAADYSSLSGSLQNRPDAYHEWRGSVGKDFVVGGHAFSTYAGLGYRRLTNDLRGITDVDSANLGRPGYRRSSIYTSLPIGITHRTALQAGVHLTTTVEYAHLIRGKQGSRLSDANAALQDIINTQRDGHGLRLGVMARFDKWSLGPTVTLWRIKASDAVLGFVEPENETNEVGFRVVYHF